MENMDFKEQLELRNHIHAVTKREKTQKESRIRIM